MHIGVGFVFELAAEEPTVGARQLHRLGQHADAAKRRRGQDDLRSEEAQDLAPLDAEVLGHHDDERVALGRADHRQTDPGVAAGGLDDGLAGAQQASALGILDHPEREPVLDRAQRVEGLDLDVEPDARRGQAVDPYHRGATDRVEDRLVKVGHPEPPFANHGFSARTRGYVNRHHRHDPFDVCDDFHL